MSSDPLKKVTAGEKFRMPAPAYNAFVDAAADLRRRQHDGGPSLRGTPGGTQTVLVRNTTGTDLAQFSVVAIGAPLITPTDNLNEFNRVPPFAAALPVAAIDVIGILQEPIAAGKCGEAMLTGVTPVLLTVTTAGDKHAAPAADSSRLVTGSSGPWRVIYAESGTGSKLGIVISPSDANGTVIVKITGNASGGGKYTGRILTGESTAVATGDESQPEGMTVPPENDCLVLNLGEDGSETHALSAGTFAVGKVVAPGIVEISAFDPSAFAHPWKVTTAKDGDYFKWSCTNGRPLSDPASAAGRVYTREADATKVAEVRGTTISATATVCCRVTVSDSPSVTASIVAVAGDISAVDCWKHTTADGVVRDYPLALITFVDGVPGVYQVCFSDIDVGAGVNVNDDDTSLLTDGTTEFLVLTAQGASGSTAAAKVRKLTVQVDHGNVIRWSWGTPATAICLTSSTLRRLTGNFRFGTGGDAGKLQYEYVVVHMENGVVLYEESPAVWDNTGMTVDLTTQLDLAPNIRVDSGNVEVSALKVKLAVAGNQIALAAGDRGAWAGPAGCPDA